jgi:hypothetical protein
VALVRVWVNRTPGGEFLGGCRLPTIVITCRRRVTPPRLNGVRINFDEPGSWPGRRWVAWNVEPTRVRTCRGRRR